MKSIRARLVLTYLLLVAFSLIVAGGFFLSWMERAFEQRARAQLATQSQVLGHFMSIYTQHEDDLPDSAHWLMREFPSLTRARIRVTQSEGKVLQDSRSKKDDALEASGATALEEGRQVTWTRASDAGLVVHSTTPIILEYPERKVVGAVDVSAPVTELDDTFQRLRTSLLGALALALLASCLVALWLARQLSQPILSMRHTADVMAGGDLKQRAEVDSGPLETRQLGQSINHMAEQLQGRLEQLTSERNRVRLLLASLPDPVLTLDSNKLITYANPAAERALTVTGSQAQGKKLEEIWPGPADERLLQGPVAEPVGFEVNLKEQVFRATLLPYVDPEQRPGTLVVLRDMTDIRRLEDVRNLFLGSVSHELRTPLTIIKGFAATLEDHPNTDEALKKPLFRIDQEADRLTRLVNDLLDLTKMRSQKLSLDLALVPPNEVVGDAVELLGLQAQRKEVELKTELQECRPFMVDPDRLKQIVINLVDNAIKFTPPGGKVTVTTTARPGRWLLEVADTGPGVPAEELPHLFDHFFRSREVRKVGGTGLGLAIVREIVERHGGNIDAESAEGQGTTFRVSLPMPEELT